MRHFHWTFLLGSVLLSSYVDAAEAASKPIALHPDNPHYFDWHGEPTILMPPSSVRRP